MKSEELKPYLLPVAIVIAGVLIAGAVLYNSANTKVPSNVTPTPTSTITVLPTTVIPTTKTPTVLPTTVKPTPTIADKDALYAAVLKKSGIPKAKFEFSVGTISGNLAKGSVRNSDDISGAAWFAGKSAGTWKVVYIGQGVPLCSEIVGWNFPTSWISHCVNAQGNTVAR